MIEHDFWIRLENIVRSVVFLQKRITPGPSDGYDTSTRLRGLQAYNLNFCRVPLFSVMGHAARGISWSLISEDRERSIPYSLRRSFFRR